MALAFVHIEKLSAEWNMAPVAHLGEKQFTVEQIGQLNQPLLHRLPSTLRNVQISPQWGLLVAREENALCVCAVIQEGNPRAHQITGHVHHLCHEV